MEREFFISSEIYASAHAVSEIIRDICEKIDERNFTVSEFCEGIDDIGVIVNCFPKNMMEAGWGKPRKYISYKNRSADIRLPIPYDDFIAADSDKKYLMVVKNIVVSLEVIEQRCNKSKRAAFDSKGMIKKFLDKLGVTVTELDGINGVEEI
ncbi:MAG: hypothetical protein J6A07_06880 [Firmicutes bacterium]|nr:hypothetical protein [Bacillota bacterium]